MFELWHRNYLENFSAGEDSIPAEPVAAVGGDPS
jgi:hypothetical protein